MAAGVMDQADLHKKIIAIQLDQSLTDAQKAQKRQDLMSGKWKQVVVEELEDKDGGKGVVCPAWGAAQILVLDSQHCDHSAPTWFTNVTETDTAKAGGSEAMDETLKCALCMELANRPITVCCAGLGASDLLSRVCRSAGRVCPCR